MSFTLQQISMKFHHFAKFRMERQDANLYVRVSQFAPASPLTGRIFESVLFEIIQSERSKQRDSFQPAHESPASHPSNLDC